jgi:hypothetical protein
VPEFIEQQFPFDSGEPGAQFPGVTVLKRVALEQDWIRADNHNLVAARAQPDQYGNVIV